MVSCGAAVWAIKSAACDNQQQLTIITLFAGHNFVGTEQILLGLIGESTGIAAKVLKSMGVNLKDARVEVEKIIGRGSGFVAVEIPFTPRAKRVLELSLEEARQLGTYAGRSSMPCWLPAT